MSIIREDLEKYLDIIREIEKIFPDIQPESGVSSMAPHELKASSDNPAMDCNHAMLTVTETHYWFVLSYRERYSYHNRPVNVNLYTVGGKLENWDRYKLDIQKHAELLTENEKVPVMETQLVLSTITLLNNGYSH